MRPDLLQVWRESSVRLLDELAQCKYSQLAVVEPAKAN